MQFRPMPSQKIRKMTMWPNTVPEPTQVTPVMVAVRKDRCGFRVGGSPRRRRSAFGR
jgi:hypothetical protein